MNETKEILEATKSLLDFFNSDNEKLSETLQRQKETFGRTEGDFFILNPIV